MNVESGVECVYGECGYGRLGRALNDGQETGFIQCHTGRTCVPSSLKFSPPRKLGSANDHAP